MASMRTGVGPMKAMPLCFQPFGESSAFSDRKPIARMDGLGAGGLHGLDDLVGDQIGFARRGAADMNGFVGHFTAGQPASASE